MNAFFASVGKFLKVTAPWWGLLLASFALCYVLTPICRELARKCGMVDKPSARRINKVPIPRGGGLAIYLSSALVSLGVSFFTDIHLVPTGGNVVVLRLIALSGALVAVGLLDDKFGLPPLVKLGGQVAVALGTFFWAGVGFHSVPIQMLKELPVWLDCALTLFWIVGAINAFNLIDGLDGLATGLALIASFGMGGALFFVGYPESTLVYFIFVGACLAFLRYNFHPASVFLGDTGSMFLGFSLSTLPLAMKSGDSFFISFGVPILAMGVPIFDTSLAIFRRSVRALLRRHSGENEGNSHVMQADTDHLHHRILRKLVSQRKAAGALYALALFFVVVGFGALALRDRAAGFFALAFIVATVVMVRDMRRVELWDAGRLLDSVAHDRRHEQRRRRRMLVVPYFVISDVLLLIVACVFSYFAMGHKVNMYALHTALPIRVVPMFFFLVLARVYSTIWARAKFSNFIRLGCAVFLGAVVSSAGIILFNYPHRYIMAFTVVYFVLSLLLLCASRLLRPALRDIFYAINYGRLADNPATSRVLVYGAGLRYAMFRSELVRNCHSEHRIIVGLLDDNILLRGLYVGGQEVLGTLDQAKAVIEKLRVDSVVIACVLTPERLALAKKIFTEAGVKVTLFSCEEQEL